MVENSSDMYSFDLPHDADGDAIRRVLEDGSNLSRPMKVDFVVAVPDEATGRRFADLALEEDFEVELSHDAEDDLWTVYCSKLIFLTHAKVVAIQQQLNELSAHLGGYADGWGTFGNADTAS